MKDKSKNPIVFKSQDFAVRIAKLYRYLAENKKEYVMSKQLLKSGTSIGANVFEAVEGQSRADFRSKINIALKEANETLYWIVILRKSEYLTEIEYNSLYPEAEELKRILVSIVKSTGENNSE